MNKTVTKTWTRKQVIELSQSDVEKILTEHLLIKGNENVFTWDEYTGDLVVESKSSYPYKRGSRS